jgi:hypothetical protein
MRLVIVLVTVVASSFGGPLPASAQPAQSEGSAQSLVVGVGGGGTIYSIATRLGSGSTVTAMAGYRLSPALLVEGAVRRHQCFDCDRFLIAEGGLQVGYPGRTVSPFVSGGYGDQFGSRVHGDRHRVLSWFRVVALADGPLGCEARGPGPAGWAGYDGRCNIADRAAFRLVVSWPPHPTSGDRVPDQVDHEDGSPARHRVEQLPRPRLGRRARWFQP